MTSATNDQAPGRGAICEFQPKVPASLFQVYPSVRLPLPSRLPVKLKPATVPEPRQKMSPQFAAGKPGLIHAASVIVLVFKFNGGIATWELEVEPEKCAARIAGSKPGNPSAGVGPVMPLKPFCAVTPKIPSKSPS